MIIMMIRSKTMIESNCINSAFDVSFQTIQPLREFDFVNPYNLESTSSGYSWYFTFCAANYQTLMSSFLTAVFEIFFH